MKRSEITIGQGLELLTLARRLTPDEYQARHRWLERLTDPDFNPDTIRIEGPQTFDLGDGFVFTVDEVIELEVDDTVEPDELLWRGGHNPSDWEYVGKKPESGVRTVRAAIGRLNRPWTEEQVTGLLTRPNCPVKGSGAWVREAYLKAHPRYDGKGCISFPDSTTSRWRSQGDGYVCFPSLWSGGHDWSRGLDRVRRGWSVEDRLCLLCG